MTSSRTLRLQQGECIDSIAFRNGLLAHTVWDRSENATLRTKRKDRNVLLPGDELYVPAVRERVEAKPTELRHKFRRKLSKATLTLVLREDGEARANLRYTMTIGDSVRHNQTDANGKLSEPISPVAEKAILSFDDFPDEAPTTVWIRYLCPADEPYGAQQRLANLGFFGGEFSDEWTEEGEAALCSFQRRENLEASGKLNDATIAKLREAHGS